ncbi:unnamed protein product, partial [Ilex paraguariensis]
IEAKFASPNETKRGKHTLTVAMQVMVSNSCNWARDNVTKRMGKIEWTGRLGTRDREAWGESEEKGKTEYDLKKRE